MRPRRETHTDGHLGDDALVPILEALRRTLGDPGELRHEAGARIWSATQTSGRSVTLTTVEHKGRTTLRLEERMSAEAHAIVGATAFVSASSDSSCSCRSRSS